MPKMKEVKRKECFKILQHARVTNKYYRDALVNLHLHKIFNRLRGKNILVYMPLDIEADITKAVQRIRKKNNLFVPLMEDVSFKIVPLRLPLSQNKLKIYEPGNSIRKTNNIDVAIIPAIGVDKKARRIGFGKGMYDRFFADMRKDPYKIFVQSQICYINQDVCDDFDISCNMLITPKVTLLQKRKSDVNYNTFRAARSHSQWSIRFFHL
jgi:5-formyltetrahydrofolate cyclo-ligase